MTAHWSLELGLNQELMVKKKVKERKLRGNSNCNTGIERGGLQSIKKAFNEGPQCDNAFTFLPTH